jgi:general secretion pathway protein G
MVMQMRRQLRAFTLIELLVVLAVLAILAGIVTPNYLDRVEDAKEVTLRHNLIGLRAAIDQFYRDKGRYPESLADLAAHRYIRAIPVDPITQRADSWQIVAPASSGHGGTSVFDVKSGAQGRARDGSEYAGW